jgi:type 1 fimbria pilin
MIRKRNWLIVLLTLALSSMTAYAQVTANASIRGTVLDSTGAVVVGADVTVSNSATGFSRTVKTGKDW